MASIVERRLSDGSMAYLVRFRTGDGKQQSKQFKRKGEADDYVSLVEVDRHAGPSDSGVLPSLTAPPGESTSGVDAAAAHELQRTVSRRPTETRSLLIETGIAMLHERGVIAGVSHIRLQEVVKRAGLTTGAAYRLWCDQKDFHRELAVAATGWRDDVPIHRTIAAIRHLVDEHAPLHEVVRMAAAAHVEGLGDAHSESRTPATFLTTLALRATARNNPELQAASSARHKESIDSFIQLYATLMSVYNLRLRPPFTMQNFAVCLAALGEGFALQVIEGQDHPIVHLAGPDERLAEEWTLFGVAVDALIGALTEPIAPTEETRDAAPDK